MQGKYAEPSAVRSPGGVSRRGPIMAGGRKSFSGLLALAVFILPGREKGAGPFLLSSMGAV